MKKVLLIFGTRPEAIKMAPLIATLRSMPESFGVSVCVTAQHRHMLDQVLKFFEIVPEYDLNIMRPGQSLHQITAAALLGLESVVKEADPAVVVVQGDTTTAFVGALAAYYARKPVAHLEAGLRSGDRYSPYPEEINRVLVGHLAEYHFAPTDEAACNLRREGVVRNVWTVGNTVIDALLIGLQRIGRRETEFRERFPFVNSQRRLVLVTGHRRENFGKPLEDVCCALRELALAFQDIELVYPVHMNPNVREPVNRILSGLPNVHLIEPVEYPELIWLLSQSFFVMTDSGGIQEEAPSLGKPVLVMRDVTERMEGVRAGNARLVGTSQAEIFTQAARLLTDLGSYRSMAAVGNPYGDGHASEKIAAILSNTGGSDLTSNTAHEP